MNTHNFLAAILEGHTGTHRRGVQGLPGPGGERSKVYQVQGVRGPGFTGSRGRGAQGLPGPGGEGSRVYRVQGARGPGFTGSRVYRGLQRTCADRAATFPARALAG